MFIEKLILLLPKIMGPKDIINIESQARTFILTITTK